MISLNLNFKGHLKLLICKLSAAINKVFSATCWLFERKWFDWDQGLIITEFSSCQCTCSWYDWFNVTGEG